MSSISFLLLVLYSFLFVEPFASFFFILSLFIGKLVMWSQFGRPRHSSRRVGQKQMDENFLEKIKNYSCFPRFSFDGCTISTADQEMALIKHNVTPFARQASSPSWRWRLWIRTGPALSHSSFSFSFFPFWSKKGGCGFVVNRQARHAIATHLHIARRCTLAARKRLAKKKKHFLFFSHSLRVRLHMLTT